MLRSLLHIALSLAVLISSAGLIVNKHYCQQELKKTALFFKSDSCHNIAGITCAHHQKKQTSNCCDDQTSFYKLDQDQQIQAAQLKAFKLPVFTAILVVFLRQPLLSILSPVTHYCNYKPPLIRDTLPSLLQSFLL